MPTRNVAQYIEEAINSVLNQDHPSFELLIGNDGSTDHTGLILNRYSKRSKVRVFHNRERKGAAYVRNLLISKARGKYLCPVDSDDVLLPGALKRLASVLDANPKVGLVYPELLVIGVDKRDRFIKRPTYCGKSYAETWDLMEDSINHGGSMMRKSLVDEVGGYDERMFSLDDLSLKLKLAERSEIKFLQGEVFYLWRKQPRSMTRREKNYKRDLLTLIREAGIRRSTIST